MPQVPQAFVLRVLQGTDAQRAVPAPDNGPSPQSSMEDTPPCKICGEKMTLLRHLSFVDCPGTRAPPPVGFVCCCVRVRRVLL